MKPIVALALISVAAFGMAQDNKSGLAKPKPKPVAAGVDQSAPVTQAEAREVFARASRVLSKVTKAKLGTPGIPAAGQPVSRAMVVQEMNRIFLQAKPVFKYTPRMQKFDRTRLTLKDPGQRKNLEKLIAFNMVAPFGPLAAGAGNGLNVKEFGDAVGYFIARLADLTHLPSSKWTPALQGE